MSAPLPDTRSAPLRARRRRHFGSVRRLASGRWQASYWLEGRRHVAPVTFRAKTDALAWLSAVETDIRRGRWADPSEARTTLGEWLDHWLATVVAHRVGSDNTVANYAAVVRRHLEPGLGTIPIAHLTPEQVDEFLVAKAAAGLSKSYVGRMRTILADALSHAERRQLVSRNAGRQSIMPRCEPARPRRSFTAAEARRVLDAAAGERLHALVVTGLLVGLRPGELTGLLWSDLDFDADPPTLSVSGSMKRRPDSSLYRGPVKRSTAGERTLAMPATLTAALVAHRRRQDAERRAAGGLWMDQGLVFPTEMGTPLDPSNVRKVFARVARRAGIDPAGVVPYLPRQGAVSLPIDAGAPIEEVADLLGDAPPTIDRHRVRPVVTAARERRERLLGAESDRR